MARSLGFFRKNAVCDTAFVWLDPSKAVCVGLSYSDGLLSAKRIKHPDLPGVRWLSVNAKRTGYYSRKTEGNGYATCFFLPMSQSQWDERQERIAEAA
jgi:hypothetical protein